MSVTPCPLIVGIFDDLPRARQAIDRLKEAGFTEGSLGVIGREGEDTVQPAGPSKVAEAGAVGAAAGAGAGALWGLGIVAGVLPAIGPAVAGGVLACVLSSAALTAAVTGLVGGLVGLGVPEEQARQMEGEVQSGRTLVTVAAGERSDAARAIVRECGGRDECFAGRT